MAKKQFDISKYVENHQATIPVIEYKTQDYIIMPEAFQLATGLLGYPKGLTSFQYGLSDGGKTALLLNAVAQTQKNGDLVFLILTENKTDRKRLVEAGINLEKLVLVENLQYLEEVYDFISMKVHEMKSGKLPVDVLFAWDSVASTPSQESVEITKEGKIVKHFTNQKNANVIGFYNPIIAKLIAETREITCEGTATLIMVTQAYKTMPEFPGAPTSIVPNGGEKIFFPASLSLLVKEGKRIKSTLNGRLVEHSLITKIKVVKNHLSNLNCEGELVFIGTDMLPNDKKVLDSHKEDNKEKWEQLLSMNESNND